MRDVMRSERDFLRNELLTLKECQVKYFWTTVTATGIIIGIGSNISTDYYKALTFFAPLLIILPSWIIFFDKATTITRIVGYLRVLENMIIGNNNRFKYLGWESALALFRDCQVTENMSKDNQTNNVESKGKRFWRYLKEAGSGIKLLSNFEARNRYWIMSWFVFFGLSVFCLAMSWYYRSHRILTIIFIMFTTMASIHNLYLLYNLCDPNGKFSYGKKEALWRNILKING